MSHDTAVSVAPGSAPLMEPGIIRLIVVPAVVHTVVHITAGINAGIYGRSIERSVAPSAAAGDAPIAVHAVLYDTART